MQNIVDWFSHKTDFALAPHTVLYNIPLLLTFHMIKNDSNLLLEITHAINRAICNKKYVVIERLTILLWRETNYKSVQFLNLKQERKFSMSLTSLFLNINRGLVKSQVYVPPVVNTHLHCQLAQAVALNVQVNLSQLPQEIEYLALISFSNNFL